MDFLFVGTCRGGTAYVCEVLKSLGLRAGHEKIFTRGGVNRDMWNEYDADVSWLAVPHLHEVKDLEVVRVVRNPMDVVNSILRLGLDREAGFWNFVNEATGRWRKWERAEDRVAQYYLDWHERISERAWDYIRVEDGGEPIACMTGRWADTLYDNRKCNHKNGVGREMGELAGELRGQLCSFMDAHGYELKGEGK